MQGFLKASHHCSYYQNSFKNVNVDRWTTSIHWTYFFNVSKSVLTLIYNSMSQRQKLSFLHVTTRTLISYRLNVCFYLAQTCFHSLIGPFRKFISKVFSLNTRAFSYIFSLVILRINHESISEKFTWAQAQCVESSIRVMAIYLCAFAEQTHAANAFF